MQLITNTQNAHTHLSSVWSWHKVRHIRIRHEFGVVDARRQQQAHAEPTAHCFVFRITFPYCSILFVIVVLCLFLLPCCVSDDGECRCVGGAIMIPMNRHYNKTNNTHFGHLNFRTLTQQSIPFVGLKIKHNNNPSFIVQSTRIYTVVCRSGTETAAWFRASRLDIVRTLFIFVAITHVFGHSVHLKNKQSSPFILILPFAGVGDGVGAPNKYS